MVDYLQCENIVVTPWCLSQISLQWHLCVHSFHRLCRSHSSLAGKLPPWSPWYIKTSNHFASSILHNNDIPSAPVKGDPRYKMKSYPWGNGELLEAFLSPLGLITGWGNCNNTLLPPSQRWNSAISRMASAFMFVFTLGLCAAHARCLWRLQAGEPLFLFCRLKCHPGGISIDSILLQLPYFLWKDCPLPRAHTSQGPNNIHPGQRQMPWVGGSPWFSVAVTVWN